ncbi:DUF1871 family protein [Lysinibacillus sp. NPDC048646]|uniref:DUF1871 family protein n=1 Tax=Lysinibacillus sp. NPDC048646 TaxID=3390574 RepID=UPI003D06B3AB
MQKNSHGQTYNEKYNIVKEIIDSWDPMCLRHHAPEGEYEPEIVSIVSALDKSKSNETLAGYIEKIFFEMFESTILKKKCMEIAREIRDRQKNR